MGKIEEWVETLTSIDQELRLKSLKNLKNAVIGSKTNKISCIQHGAIPKLTEILSVERDSNLLFQAVALTGSLACGNEEGVEALLAADVLPLLFKALANPHPRVTEAAARALKTIFQSSRAPRGALFAGDTMALLIGLLTKGTDPVAEMAATILARCCDTPEHQAAIAAAGALNALISSLSSSYPKSQEAALDVLAGLTRDNQPLAQTLCADTNAISLIIKLTKDKRPRTRLLAATCIANVSRAKALPEQHKDITVSIISTIVKLFSEQDDIRHDAPLVLAHHICDSEELQKAACDADAVSKLATFLISPCSSARLKQSSLTALAALSAGREESRKQVIDSKVLPAVVAALEDPDPAIRAAACNCTRSLSRSVKNLRTSLVDAGVAIPLLKLLHDPSTAVQTLATASVCNIVLDFSPMKKIVLDNGGLQRLVELVHSMDAVIRLNAVWALKNLIFSADLPVKDTVLNELTYPTLFTLMCDHEIKIQEQAVTLLRNLVCGKVADIQKVFDGAGEKLIPTIETILDTTNADVATQALYVICNIATGNENHKNALMVDSLLSKVFQYMSHGTLTVRVAAVWVVINLTWRDDPDPSTDTRIAKLRQMGFESLLNTMVDDADKDVQERVKAALNHFENKRS